jgi:dimethylamine/trimethylamine dehydrogenase
LGGSFRWVPELPGLGEWARVVNWRRVQLDKLRNVEVITGTRLSAADVLEYGAELVVVATGARWASDGVNGVTHQPVPGADASLPHVLTPEQVMLEGKRPAGDRVLVWDGEGYFTAPGIAELLGAEGYAVELATLHERIAPYCDETLEGPLLRQHLHRVGVVQRRGFVLSAIEPGRALAADEYGEPVELAIDSVVLVTQRLSQDALYHELVEDEEALAAAGIEAVYRVGDCVAPRVPADAIFDGHRLAREIDSPNPAVPLPFRRERLVLEVAHRL